MTSLIFPSKTSQGLLVLGTEAACGKTVVMTGLAALLRQEGFATSALKPVIAGSRKESAGELAFISTIAKSPLTYQVNYLADSGLLTDYQWSQALRTCQSTIEFKLVELPGGCATTIATSGCKDSALLAAELAWPCLLVAKVGSDCLEKMVLSCHYLRSCGLNPIGQVLVHTSQHSPAIASDYQTSMPMEIMLSQRTGVPFLGTIAYSPSINVDHANQGNLIKTISTSLDLLPLIKTLNLPVCT